MCDTLKKVRSIDEVDMLVEVVGEMGTEVTFVCRVGAEGVICDAEGGIVVVTVGPGGDTGLGIVRFLVTASKTGSVNRAWTRW